MLVAAPHRAVAQLLDAPRAGRRRSELVEHGQTGARRGGDQPGRLQRVLGDVGARQAQPPDQPRQGQALDQQRAGDDGERGEGEQRPLRGPAGSRKTAASVTTPRMPAQETTTLTVQLHVGRPQQPQRSRPTANTHTTRASDVAPAAPPRHGADDLRHARCVGATPGQIRGPAGR